MTTRRQFLAAAPLALAAPALPAAKAAPPQRRRVHDLEEAADDNCNCRRCVAGRVSVYGTPAHAAAACAAGAAVAALERLGRDHCTDGDPCDLCLDALGAPYALRWTADGLDGMPIYPDGHKRRMAAALARAEKGEPVEAALLLTYDALDELLDFVVGYSDSQCRDVCLDADAGVYYLRSALSLIGCMVRLTPAVARRALLSAQRKVARKVGPREQLPHTQHEHDGCGAEVECCREALGFCVGDREVIRRALARLSG